MSRRYLIATLACAGLAFAPLAHADDTDDSSTPGDNTTNEVCTAFNLGVPPGQIPGMLHANDGRENYWQAWNSTMWPIIEGRCDNANP